jgi:hypothetical protein
METLPGAADTRGAPRTAPRRLTHDCTAAQALALPEAHMRCRARGPLLLPAFTAPVLPAERCDCGCHLDGGAQ